MMIRVGDTLSTPVGSEGVGGLREPSIDGELGVESEGAGLKFSDVLGELVARSAEASKVSATKADLLARGVSDDLHGTMIAAKEAEISLKLVGTIRNKVLDAFQELWRTNV